jgi:hypothetical protein
MPPYDYNDIRNDDWYNRLVRGIRERTSADIRRTGSQADDPYWRAKEAQKIGDLSNARQDAFRRAFAAARNRQAALGAAARGREEYRQRIISDALRRQLKPEVGLGVQDEDIQAPYGLGSVGPEPALLSPEQPTEAYPRQPAPPSVYERDRSAAPGGGVYTSPAWAERQAASGGFAPVRPSGVYAGYDPTVFMNPSLTRRRRSLDENYANLAKRWI